MRILHTADWHIGQTLNGWSREAEHGAFLAALPDLVASQEVDALVVAGDVFDGINPSADAMQLLYESLVALNRRRPHLTTVLIAGNHDPAGRLEAPAALLRAFNVHVVGTVHRREGGLDLERHLLPLCDAGGETRAHVLAIPFLRAADLAVGPGTDGEETEEPGSPVVRATRRLYAEAITAARRRIGGSQLIATGHLHCSGAAESEGAERRILVGGEHAVPHDIFPVDLAYVALGHLHRHQNVGRSGVRYSGSPFPMSATELPYEHGATLVQIGGQDALTEHLPLARPVPCLRLPGSGALPPGEIASALAALALPADTPRERQPFVHVVVAPEGSAAGLAGEVERILEEWPVRCAGVKIERPAAASSEAAPAPVSLAECDPGDLFERAFQDCHGQAPSTEHRDVFETVLGEL